MLSAFGLSAHCLRTALELLRMALSKFRIIGLVGVTLSFHFIRTHRNDYKCMNNSQLGFCFFIFRFETAVIFYLVDLKKTKTFF